MGGLVWLASYPKSGNTWTRNFLHTLLSDEATVTHDINSMQSKTSWDSSYRWYKPFLNGKKFMDCSMAELAAVRMQANAYMAEAAGNGLLFVKTHNAMMSDHGGVPLINAKVTAGVVYIIRNPLDVVISYSHHNSMSIDKTLEFMARSSAVMPLSEKMAYELQGSWSEHVMSWTRKPNPALHIMRYEDMQQDTLGTFIKLVKFLRIDVNEKKIAQAIDASSFNKLKQMEELSGFKEKPDKAKEFFRKGEVGEWRTVLNKRQIQEIVHAHGEQMQRFGYLPEQLAATDASS
jgi:hypothetical protein